MIFMIIRASLRNRERLNISIRNAKPRNANHNRRQRSEEIRHAMVLFGVVIVFFICHILRIILDMEELITYEDRHQTMEIAQRIGEMCEGVQFWTMITADISHFLILVNSSINFYIYCFLSRQFKSVLKDEFMKLVQSFGLDKTVSEISDNIDSRKDSLTRVTSLNGEKDGLELEQNNKAFGKDFSGSDKVEEIVEI